ncbi:MAG: hypothetical protein ABFC57_09415 [Veillonellales bacterium]
MNQDIFADGIGNINVTKNIVRIDFAALQPQLKSENGQPVFATNQRIVMPLEGFIQGLALQQNIVQQLIQAGVLQVNAAPAPVAAAEPAAATEAAAAAESAAAQPEEAPNEEPQQTAEDNDDSPDELKNK